MHLGGSVHRQVGTLFDDGTTVALADGVLIERFAQRRDEAAFAALVERHGPMVLRVCRAALRDEHEAHDAFQAAFLVLVRRARTLWVRETVGPWLHGVAWRVASRARAAGVRRRRLERRAAEMVTRTVAEGPATNDIEATLHAEIHRLSDRFRAVVVLCDLEGLSTDEAAHRLGIPVGTARSRLARGRDRLRSRLIRLGIAPAAITAITSQTASAASHLHPALAEATLRTAIAFAKVGTVPAPILFLIKGEHQIMKIKAWTTIVLTSSLVAGTGALIAQTPGKGPDAAKAPVNAETPKPAVAKPTNPDDEALRGEWKVVTVKQNGVVNDKTEFAGSSFTFELGHLTISNPQNGGTARFWYTLQENSRLKEMFVGNADQPNSNEKRWWIFDVNLNTLKMAFSPLPVIRLSRFDHVDREHPVVLVELTRVVPRPEAPRVETKPTPTDVASDLERLQGRWTVIRASAEGKELGDVGVIFATMTFRGEEMEQESRLPGPNRIRFRFKIDPDGDPKAMRLVQTDPSDDKPVWLLYAFERDKLRLALSDGLRRPTSFKSSPELPLAVFELVREVATPQAVPKKVDDPAQVKSPDLERMQGRWKSVRMLQNGREILDPSVGNTTMTVRGDRLEMASSKGKAEWQVYQVDEKSTPRALQIGNGATSKDRAWWIYAFTDDRLRIHLKPVGLGDGRPRSFDDHSSETPFVVVDFIRDEPSKSAVPATEPTSKAVAATELARLQGLWSLTKVWLDGKESPVEKGKTNTYIQIHNDEIMWISRPGAIDMRYRIEIDAASEPRVIRAYLIEKQGITKAPETRCWIYTIKDDVLTIGTDIEDADRRPRSFEDFGKDGHSLWTVECVAIANSRPKSNVPIETKPMRSEMAETDRGRLLGRWVVRKARANGREIEDSAMALATVTFERDQLQFLIPGKGQRTMAYRIDPDARPKAFRVADFNAQGSPGVWIYAFEGGQGGGLKVAFDQSPQKPRRPKDFDDFDPDHPLVVLELDRDETKPADAAPHNTKPIAAEGELARLKGTWKVIAREENGEDTLNGEESVIIAGDAIIALANVNNLSDSDVSTFTIDPSHEPKSIALTRGDRPDAKPIHGIYRIDGFTLMICVNLNGDTRPTEFDTKAGSGHRLMVLRRKKPARPPVASPAAPVDPAR
jgi:RNA polymerase sigma factor (sigma-70 family)